MSADTKKIALGIAITAAGVFVAGLLLNALRGYDLADKARMGYEL